MLLLLLLLLWSSLDRGGQPRCRAMHLICLLCLTHIGICLLPVPSKTNCNKVQPRGGAGAVGGFAVAVTICVQLRKNKSKRAGELV